MIIGEIIQVILQFMKFAIVNIIIPLFPLVLYFLLFCIVLTFVGNLSGILGFFLFIILFYYYVKGIIFYQPPVKGVTNGQNN